MHERSAPAPFAAALRDGGHGCHAEFLADGSFDTGSIMLADGVTIRATRDHVRLVVPRLPDMIAIALQGRHVSSVVSHPWLADERLVIERVDEEDGRMSILLGDATVPLVD